MVEITKAIIKTKKGRLLNISENLLAVFSEVIVLMGLMIKNNTFFKIFILLLLFHS